MLRTSFVWHHETKYGAKIMSNLQYTMRVLSTLKTINDEKETHHVEEDMLSE